LVDVSELNALIALLRTVASNDLIQPQDHNSQSDCVKKIRDILQAITVGEGAGLDGFAHGKIEVADEKTISRTSSGVKFRSLRSLKLGISSMEWLNFWMNLQGELKVSAEGCRSIVQGAIHTGNHPENEEIDAFPSTLGDYVWSNSISEYDTSYDLGYTSYLNNSRVGMDFDVYLVLWFGIESWYETALTAYCRNVKYHLPVFCHVV
jgi:hypothetical protein